jgi:hypothetical protein
MLAYKKKPLKFFNKFMPKQPLVFINFAVLKIVPAHVQPACRFVPLGELSIYGPAILSIFITYCFLKKIK